MRGNPKNPGGLRPPDPRYYYTYDKLSCLPTIYPPLFPVRSGTRGGVNSLISPETLRSSEIDTFSRAALFMNPQSPLVVLESPVQTQKPWVLQSEVRTRFS